MDKALRESEKRYHAVITQAMEGIIFFDITTLAIIETNPAVRNVSGYTEKELESMKISDLMPYSFRITDTMIAKPDSEQPVQLGEQKFLCKDKSLLDVECSVSFIRHSEKNMTVCLIAHDVTERKKAETALCEANKKLNLMGEITRHDLLNQIMALKSYFQFSNEYVKDPVHAALIKKEEDIIRTLERQITFTRDYQNMGLKRPVWQNVAEMMDKAIAELPAKKVKIDAGPRDLEIFADSLFEKVFYNLIDNSLRYGKDRLTSIRISSSESGAGLILTCEDDGVGIPDDEKDKIFHLSRTMTTPRRGGEWARRCRSPRRSFRSQRTGMCPRRASPSRRRRAPFMTSVVFRKNSIRFSTRRRAIPHSPAGFNSFWRRWP